MRKPKPDFRLRAPLARDAADWLRRGSRLQPGPAIDCAVGYKLSQQAGSCCPTCVPDSSCTMGQQGYSSLRQKLLAEPGATACMVSNDCTLLASNFYCGDQCAQIPVSVATAQSIERELSGYAKNNCSTCSPIYPPCAVPQPLTCVRNECLQGN